ncbi:hypothetical protein ABZ815_51720 [Nonomuraea sp. NPDC047529]
MAEFVVEAVQAHATRLRFMAAFDDVAREREKLPARPEQTCLRGSAAG